MKGNFEMKDILKIVDKVADTVKYFCDKNAESAKKHDETLKEMNTKDNDTKIEIVNLVISLAAPLVAAITGLLVSQKEHLIKQKQ